MAASRRTPITRAMMRWLTLALSGSGSAKGWIVTDDEVWQEDAGVRMGDVWYERNAPEVAGLDEALEQLEALNWIAKMSRRPGWIVTPLGYDEVARRRPG